MVVELIAMSKLFLCTSDSQIYTKDLINPPSADVKDYLSISKLIGRLTVQNICDRTGYVKTPYDFKVIMPVASLDGVIHNPSFNDLCIERGIELVNHSRSVQKPLVVMWSGGIDSTCVLAALLQACDGDYSCLKVGMSIHSIRENPNFYYKYIRGKVETLPPHEALVSIRFDNILVSGEGADQLFGTDIYRKINSNIGFDSLLDPYTLTNITDFLTSVGMTNYEANKWFSIMDSQIKNTQLCEVKTFKDFWWWYNFCYKWQYVYFRVMIMADTIGIDIISQKWFNENFKQFFMTESFERWSMLNPDQKIGKDWSSYKFPAKEFIYSFDKNEEYKNNKVKVSSLINVIRSTHFPVAGLNDLFEILEPDFDITPYRLKENSFI